MLAGIGLKKFPACSSGNPMIIPAPGPAAVGHLLSVTESIYRDVTYNVQCHPIWLIHTRSSGPS